MTLLIQNEAHRGAERLQHPRYQDMNTSYSEFLVTHSPLFSGGRGPLEADDWLTILLQDRLILSQNLSYNELASAAIDQEGTMKACEADEEKKRKRVVSGPSGDSSISASPKYRMIYTPPAGQPRRPPPQFWGNRPQQQYNCAPPAQ
jgi:hypothetical protein